MADIITVDWKGDMLFETDTPRGQKHKFLMDDGANGEDSLGQGPKAMMLSGLAGCSGLDIISILKKMKAQIEDFKMIAKGELTTEHPKTYHSVNLEYHFYGSNLDEKKINKAVNLSIDKYCGVMEMFRQFAKLTTSIHFHNN